MRAEAETEIALIQRRVSGRREIVAVQQEASTIEWMSDSVVEQRITGYRSEQVGMSYATTRIYRVGWIVPLLAGDRIRLRLPSPAGVSKVEKTLDPVVRPLRRLLAEPETVATVHPLARDGGRYYTYPRVDTLQERMPNGDSVDVLRIAVVRREDVPAGTSVFEGDVEIDARTMLVVRLRGRVFIVSGYALKVRDALSDQVRIVGFIDMYVSSPARARRAAMAPSVVSRSAIEKACWSDALYTRSEARNVRPSGYSGDVTAIESRMRAASARSFSTSFLLSVS